MLNKKIISLFIVVSLILSIGYPLLAFSEEDLTVFYYDDFETGYEVGETNIKSIDGVSLGDKGGVIKRAINDEGNYVLQMSTDPNAGYNNMYFSKNITVPEKPKLVLEYKVKANLIGGSPNIGYMRNYGVPTAFLTKTTVLPNTVNDKSISEIETQSWNTITIVYDNESPDRDIFLNGKNLGAYSGEEFTYGNTYAETGELKLNFSATIQLTSKVEYDYIKVYECPADYTPETFDPFKYRGLGVTVPKISEDSFIKTKSSYDLLLEMGFYNTEDLGEYQEETPMTRINFAVLLARALNINPNTKAEGIYKDIAARHFAAGRLETLRMLNLINGISEDTFGSNDPITFAQAVTALIRALGYEELAQNTGGYPIGYFEVARRIGLTTGISVRGNDTLTQSQALSLFKVFLEKEVFNISGIGDRTYVKEPKDGVNILSIYSKITTFEGIVSSNQYTSLDKTAGVSNGKIKIGSMIFSSEDKTLQECLGLKVKVYYNENDEIVTYEVSKHNSAITVNANQFEGYADGFIRYIESDRIINQEIPVSSHVIYNGKSVIFDKALFHNFDIGNITLIDNNGDNVYDVVIIKSYINRVVDRKNISNKSITFKNDKGTMALDTDFEDYQIMGINHNIVPFEAIKDNDVLSILKSQNDELVLIYISSSVIVGKVTEMSNNADDGYIVLNGSDKIFTTNEFFTDNPYLTLGMGGDFGIDIFGNVVSYNQVFSKEEGFAYLVSMAQESKLSSTVMVKILTADAKMIICNTGKNVMMDGKNENAVDAMNLLKDRDGVFVSQIIRYKLNEARNLVDIDTGNFNSDYEDPENSLRLSNLEEVAYNSINNSFGYNTFLKGDCVTFILPDGDVKSAPAEDYQVVTSRSLVNETPYNFKAYKMAESDLAVSVLVLSKPQTEKYNSYAYINIISKISLVINEEGEMVHKINYYSEGIEHEAYSKDDKLFENVSVGDIILIKQDSKDRIYTFQMLFDMDNSLGNNVNTVESRTAIHRNSFGYIYYLKDDLYTFVQKDPAVTPKSELIFETHRVPAYVYIYDSKREVIRTGSKNDLIDYKSNIDAYSNVFIHETRGYDYDLVIYD